jgi:hypothetical protein
MVDEPPQTPEVARTVAPDLGAPAPEPAPADGTAAEANAGPPIAEEPQAAIEREHWLRRRFEQEHEVALALMRLLLAGLSHEGRARRFWRWLIDDFRSERRLVADAGRTTDNERMLLRRVLAWLGDRGF